jgi:hypothetical protein
VCVLIGHMFRNVWEIVVEKKLMIRKGISSWCVEKDGDTLRGWRRSTSTSDGLTVIT